MGLKLENNLGTKFNLTHANNADEINLTSKDLTSTAYTVETIEELINVPSGFNTVIVKDINRGGTFVSKTEVDIDPNTGSLYTVNDGTVFAKLGGGFWVRQYSGAVNVKWFGAVGDGVTDDTQAIKNALNSKLPIFITKGEYLLSEKLTYSSTLTLLGANRDLVTLVWSESATSVGLEIIASDWENKINIEGICFKTKGTSGTALKIDYSSASGTEKRANSDIQISDNLFTGYTLQSTGFEIGIELIKTSGVVIERNDFIGAWNLVSNTVDDNTYDSKYAIKSTSVISETYALTINNNYIRYFETALLINDAEGVSIFQNDIFGCLNGIEIKNIIARKNQYRIISNHISAMDVLISINNTRHCMLAENDLDIWGGTSTSNTNRYLLKLIDCYQSTVSGTFRGGRDTEWTDLSLAVPTVYGIQVSGTTSDSTVIDKSNFYLVYTAIETVAGSVKTYIAPSCTYTEIKSTDTLILNGTEWQMLVGDSDRDNMRALSGDFATVFSNKASSPLRWNRENDGAIVGIYNNFATLAGSITISGATTAYNTTSDYRLKEDIQEIQNVISKVKALKPINFAWKLDGRRNDGFLAHELQSVVPEAAYGIKDGTNEDGSPDYQGIDQSKIIPLLTAAIKELIGRIEALENI